MPFVCGCRDLGQALRRIDEGAAMIRTKGEAGTATSPRRSVTCARCWRDPGAHAIDAAEHAAAAKRLQAPLDLVRAVAEHGRLPVVSFTAGGIATPADAALCMQLGADGVYVGSGIFKSAAPYERANAIVAARPIPRAGARRVSGGLGASMARMRRHEAAA